MGSFALWRPFGKLLVATILILQTLGVVRLAVPGDTARANGSRPEAIAVEDITYLGREIERIEYADEEFTQIVSKKTESCPPGSVLHSFPTTVANAAARGHAYIVLTGDDAADRAALTRLKQSFLPAIEAQETAASYDGSGSPRAMPARTCLIRNKSAAVSYWAGATGAGVTARAYYYQTSGCTWYLKRSEDYLFHPLRAGEDLYWDEVYYAHGQWGSWDQGCQRLYSGYTYSNFYGSSWWIYIGTWYTDETINDSSFGCSWWGEESSQFHRRGLLWAQGNAGGQRWGAQTGISQGERGGW